MYNEKQKTEFVRNYTTSVNTARACKAVFEATEKYENQWGKDLCACSTEELSPMVEELIGMRIRSKWSRIIILKDYVKWCIYTGVSGACDGMLHVTANGLAKMKRQTVANPLHLQQYLNAVFDEEAKETADNIYRCYYWLAYGGVAEEDILKIKCSDVDFENMVVYYRDTEVPIYKEALPSFRNCIQLTQFVYEHPNYTNKKTYKDRAVGDTLIRGVGSGPTLKTVRVALSRISKKAVSEGKTNLKLSYYRVWLSGLFYRMYEREQIGEKVDFSYVVYKATEDKIYKLDSCRNTQESKKQQLINDYFQDYQRWKLSYKI